MASDNHLYYPTGYKIVYPEGDRSLHRIPMRFQTLQSDRWHTTIDGETLSSIASKQYGDSQLWYVIADANFIFNPFDDLEVGQTLKIPSDEAVDKINTNSDKKAY